MPRRYAAREPVKCFCQWCERYFFATRWDAKFCSKAHRQAWYRASKKVAVSVCEVASVQPGRATRLAIQVTYPAGLSNRSAPDA
jgi:hypothetical protein